ncbi:MAG: hypothetical protein GY737_23935 [Desulfobacteraceae bacterium]|nr:hypothetical protein [Desulfobacteraceae bacterium]
MIKLLFKAIATGLLASGLLSWIHIFHSNTTLAANITLLTAAGHVVVPNGHVLDSLREMAPALRASFFFVFTAGIMVSGGAAMTWLAMDAVTSPKRRATVPYACLWLLVTLVMNAGCFSLVTAAHTLVIPLVVWLVLRKDSKIRRSGKSHSTCFIVFILAAVVTGSSFYVAADRGIFLRARDYLLWSFAPGQRICQWYYDNTSYASQALKSPLKQQVKPCWIDPGSNRPDRISRLVSRYGWLEIPDKRDDCLVIESSEANGMNLYLGGRKIVSTNLEQFFKRPGSVLKRYSEKIDTMAMFRLICLVGLIIALPLAIFTTLFLCLFYSFSRIFKEKSSSIGAGIVTTMLAVLMLFYLNPVKTKNPADNLQARLSASSPRIRIEGLRNLVRTKNNILKYKNAVDHLLAGSVPERYWLANALRLSPGGTAIHFLERLANDRSINVQCAALKALAGRGCGNRSRLIFRERIENSRHWYVQQVAYGALKRCR